MEIRTQNRGFSSRGSFADAATAPSVIEKLATYAPRIAGTPPLGLDIPESDIDILCHAPDLTAFSNHLWNVFSLESDFRIRQWVSDGRPVIASFHAYGWPFKIFGDAEPVDRQAGWRHFEIERRLLALGPSRFREALIAARMGGMKTEPAFAALLGLDGDPYQALLELEGWADAALVQLLERAGPFKAQR